MAALRIHNPKGGMRLRTTGLVGALTGGVVGYGLGFVIFLVFMSILCCPFLPFGLYLAYFYWLGSRVPSTASIDPLSPSPEPYYGPLDGLGPDPGGPPPLPSSPPPLP